MSARGGAETPKRPGTFVVRTDGAARGNPGPSAAGVVIEGPGGAVVLRLGLPLGRGTNNEAEYRALILGLEEARRLGARSVSVRTDSELLARQLEGRYRVKAPNLRPLFARVSGLVSAFAGHEVRHVPREENALADEMANMALDLRREVREPEKPD